MRAINPAPRARKAGHVHFVAGLFVCFLEQIAQFYTDHRRAGLDVITFVNSYRLPFFVILS